MSTLIDDNITPNSCNESQRVDSDDESEASMDGLGFMFDNLQASKSSTYAFPLHLNGVEGGIVKCTIESIDDNPGACISGHYLWPASQLLARHIAKNAEDYKGYRRALEVGSGSGMGGIVTACVGSGKVVFTDHDVGVLKRCEKNVEATEGIKDRCEFEEVRWGNKHDIERVRKEGRYDLVVGGDVIYSKEVVRILFETVGGLMEDRGVFVMAQSFVYDQETEEEIDRECRERGWIRTVVKENWEEKEEHEEEGEQGKLQKFQMAAVGDP